MRKVKISHDTFCDIFPSRSFSTQQRISSEIYFTERDGKFFIEESHSNLSKVAAAILIPFIIPVMLIWKGISGCFEVICEIPSIYSRSGYRIDECHVNQHGTIELMKILDGVE